MNEGLEKLKTIRHIHDMECGKDQAMDNAFEIIEKELKEYQEIKEIMRNHHCKDRFELNCKLCDYEEMLFDSEENKKKLKYLFNLLM